MRAFLALLLVAAAAAVRDDGEAVMETHSGTQKSGHCLAIFHGDFDFHGRDHVVSLQGGNCKSAGELFGARSHKLKSGTFWVRAGCRLQIWHAYRCPGYRTFFDLDARGSTSSLTHVISQIGGDAGLLPIVVSPNFGSALCSCGSAALSRLPGVNATSSAAADDAAEEDDDEDEAEDDVGKEAAADEDEDEDEVEDDAGTEAAAAADDEDAEEGEEAEEEGDEAGEDEAVDEEAEAKEDVSLVEGGGESSFSRRRAFAAKEHRPCSYLFRSKLWFAPYKQGKVRRNKCVTFSSGTYGLQQSSAAAIVDVGCRLTFYRKKRCQGSSWRRWHFTNGFRIKGLARLKQSLGSWKNKVASVGCRCVR